MCLLWCAWPQFGLAAFLPDVGDETMAHTACVFDVAGKIAAQDLFLIKKPPEKQRQDERDETDREP